VTTAEARTAQRTVGNFIGGEERAAESGSTLPKLSPTSGEPLSEVARSDGRDIDAAVRAAKAAQPDWARRTVAERGALLRRLAQLLERDADEFAALIAAETGKAPKEARGEVAARSSRATSSPARAGASTAARRPARSRAGRP
jgi:acyl-CoA reductase-like NAD-dependent aldehyde dehydrogenase